MKIKPVNEYKIRNIFSLMKIAPFIFLLIPQLIFSQVTEDFEHTNLDQWLQNETYRWDTSSIQPLSGRYSLHHIFDNTVSSHDQIILPFNTILLDSGTTTWLFSIRHGYNPSSGNNWGVFLVSDVDPSELIPGGNVNGYVLGVNFTGSDDTLRLWKITGGDATDIAATTVNWQEDVGTGKAAGLEIIRSSAGNWTINIDTSADNSDQQVIGSVFDVTYNTTSQFGIYYEYSSGQDRQLWLDDLFINGYFYTDTFPPGIDTFRVYPPDKIEIQFSEPVSENVAKNIIHYTLDQGLGNPDSAWMTDPDKIYIKFTDGFNNGQEYTLFISDVPDIKGNILVSGSVHFLYYLSQTGDVVINEIMTDPEPSVLLPEAEYIELYNNTDYDLNLNDWSICVDDKICSFPEIILKAKDYLLLTKPGNIEELKGYGNVAGIEGLPSLINSEGFISILNELRQPVHCVNYSSDWYKTTYKSEGGWSLEIIDPENFCGDKTNWSESVDYRGGTPCMQNSVFASNPDLENPFPKRAAFAGDSSVRVYFNESMDSISLLSKEAYLVDHNISKPTEIFPEGPFYKSVLLKFNKHFDSGAIYTLTIENVNDCSGNIADAGSNVRFAKATAADSLDIIINEILFNPIADGVDFVELYNRSDKTIDLKNSTLSTRNVYSGELENVCPVIRENFLVFPGDYLILTVNINKLEEQYTLKNKTNYIEPDNMPAFSDNGGVVVITDPQLNIIDELRYSESMQFALLNNVEGVSLERINSEWPTSDPGNWHSAAEDAGYATPGYENSQQRITEQESADFIVKPEVFSPDNDGLDDVLFIRYTLPDQGNVATITVFDAKGHLIRNLARNAILGTSGAFTWDGLDENHHKVSMGIYVIFIETFDLNGKTRKIKKSCVLAPSRD